MLDSPSNPREPEPVMARSVLWRAARKLGSFLLLLAVLMFVPAGIGWSQGWLFLGVFLLQMVVAMCHLWRTNPAIYVARRKVHAGTKTWDKVLLSVLLPSLLAVYPVAAVEHRFHGSSVSAGLVVVGYVLLTAGMACSVWAEQVNQFAEPGVRIQTERGHKVVDTGPYAIVRHPMYLAAYFLSFGIALALGSRWALIPAAVVGLIIVARTVLEDRTLQNELEGYREYADRVRCRLIPGVW